MICNTRAMDVFEAVAEPSRRALLDALIDGERTAGELVATLPGLRQPTVSRHLRVLREVGLVEVRPDAQRRSTRCGPTGSQAREEEMTAQDGRLTVAGATRSPRAHLDVAGRVHPSD